MNWKTKALLQNTLAKLPSGLSYKLYEFIQCKFGAYRHGVNPFGRLQVSADYVRKMVSLGGSIEGKVVLEVGSGRTLLVPVGLWLCGVEKVITVDLHPYLSEEMSKTDFRKIQSSRDELFSTFGELAENEVFKERAELLLSWDFNSMTLEEILNRMSIDYQAPADAASLEIPDDSIDLHVSVSVLEHIPSEILYKIFREGVRVCKDDAWFIHRWDMSDHFSHKDHSILPVNFLQFPEEQWSKYNDNCYMYVNRLRIDFFDQLFDEVGLEVKERGVVVDSKSIAALEAGEIKTVPPFSEKPAEVNGAVTGFFLAQQKG